MRSMVKALIVLGVIIGLFLFLENMDILLDWLPDRSGTKVTQVSGRRKIVEENRVAKTNSEQTTFPAKEIREGIKNWHGHNPYFVKNIAIVKGDGIEYPYDIEITVSSTHRVLIDSIPDHAKYTFHVDSELRLDSNYTVRGGEREEESNKLYECLKHVLIRAR